MPQSGKTSLPVRLDSASSTCRGGPGVKCSLPPTKASEPGIVGQAREVNTLTVTQADSGKAFGLQ